MNTRERTQWRIAQEAARLMIEEGVESHHAAKAKAADRLGLADSRRLLPKDEVVDEARQEYRRLFGQGRHALEVRALRLSALRVMEDLASFSPRLVGSVAEGTAGRHSPIIIHLYPETAEDVIKTLIEQGIPYREGHHIQPSGKDRTEVFPAFSLNQRGAAIDILVFPSECGIARKKGQVVELDCRRLREMLRTDPSGA